MSTAVIEPPSTVRTRRLRSTEPIGSGRVVGVELQKMFDTRSGFWLLASVGIAAVLATAATLLFAPSSEMTYGSFAAAIGMPMTVILPMISILAVTSEWSQRSGLTTFTLVPHRGKVIGAKLAATLLVGAASIAVAFSVAAAGYAGVSAIAGRDTVWDITLGHGLLILMADTCGMLMGFTLGILIRNSPGAIVAYFVYALVLPAALGTLAAFQDWFARAQGWIDFNLASTRFYDENPGATDWAHLATSGVIWLILPLAIGLALVVRSEVK